MAGKKDYRTCMADAMRGKQMSKEERQREFCLNAKLCSGKSSTREEAERLCALPKESKPKKKANCDFDAIAACAAPKIIGHILETSDINPEFLTEILRQCSDGGSQSKKLSREKFIKKCFKEHSSSGTAEVDIKEAAKLRTFCIVEYKKLAGETV